MKSRTADRVFGGILVLREQSIYTSKKLSCTPGPKGIKRRYTWLRSAVSWRTPCVAHLSFSLSSFTIYYKFSVLSADFIFSLSAPLPKYICIQRAETSLTWQRNPVASCVIIIIIIIILYQRKNTSFRRHILYILFSVVQWIEFNGRSRVSKNPFVNYPCHEVTRDEDPRDELLQRQSSPHYLFKNPFHVFFSRNIENYSLKSF